MKLLALILFSIVCTARAQIVSILQKDLQEMVDKLYKIDTNGTDPSKFKFNYDGQKRDGNKKFVLNVDPKFLKKPTVVIFKQLVAHLMRQGDRSNFQAPLGSPVSPGKKRETFQSGASELAKAITACFITLLKTEVMEQTRLFLAKNGFHQARSQKHFEDWMKTVWLTPVKIRKGREESIPFTHVFLLEKHYADVVSGLHHWLTYGLLELNNRTKFEGYVGERSDTVAVIKYVLGHSTKPKGSFLLGTTPEFDLALYTMCLLGRPTDRCNFMLKGCKITLVVHRLNQHSETSQVTTAFPKDAVCGTRKLA